MCKWDLELVYYLCFIVSLLVHFGSLLLIASKFLVSSNPITNHLFGWEATLVGK